MYVLHFHETITLALLLPLVQLADGKSVHHDKHLDIHQYKLWRCVQGYFADPTITPVKPISQWLIESYSFSQHEAMLERVPVCFASELTLQAASHWATIKPFEMLSGVALQESLQRECSGPLAQYETRGVLAAAPNKAMLATYGWGSQEATQCRYAVCYRIVDSKMLSGPIVVESCTGNPTTDFSGFVDSAKTIALVIQRNENGDQKLLRICRSGVVDVLRYANVQLVRASFSGDRVLLCQGELEKSITITMISSSDDRILWSRYLDTEAGSKFIGVSAIWSTDDQMIAKCREPGPAFRSALVLLNSVNGAVVGMCRPEFSVLREGATLLTNQSRGWAVRDTLGLKNCE